MKLLKNHWPVIDKIYLYIKDPFKSNYHYYQIWIEELKNAKAFIHYSQTIYYAYENLDDYIIYNQTKKKSVDSVWWYDIRYDS